MKNTTSLALLLTLASAACIVQGDDDDDAAAGGTSADGGGTSDGGAGAGGSTNNGGSGGQPSSGDEVGPSADPLPEASEPGAHVCAGCPEAVIDTGDADAGTATIFTFDGTVASQQGHGRFLVMNASGQFAGGGVLVSDTGTFQQTVPLFCGETLIKVFFYNEAGVSAFVRRVHNSGCLQEDVRVTIAWDETTQRWGNHLVRFAGRLNDRETDCTNNNHCGPGSMSTDWGQVGVHDDDPVHDLDADYAYMGVEDIYYPNAEDGLTVLVENGGTGYGQTPRGTLYINVHDQPTYVKQIAVLQPMEVLIAATVDGAAGTIGVIDEIYDCSGEYDANCTADIP